MNRRFPFPFFILFLLLAAGIDHGQEEKYREGGKKFRSFSFLEGKRNGIKKSKESVHEFPFSYSFMAGEYPHVVTDTNVKISLPNTSNFLLPVSFLDHSTPVLGVNSDSLELICVDSHIGSLVVEGKLTTPRHIQDSPRPNTRTPPSRWI